MDEREFNDWRRAMDAREIDKEFLLIRGSQFASAPSSKKEAQERKKLLKSMDRRREILLMLHTEYQRKPIQGGKIRRIENG